MSAMSFDAHIFLSDKNRRDRFLFSLVGINTDIASDKTIRICVPEGSVKNFQSIARRLYRIFAHAYFHHRDIFDAFEVMRMEIQSSDG